MKSCFLASGRAEQGRAGQLSFEPQHLKTCFQSLKQTSIAVTWLCNAGHSSSVESVLGAASASSIRRMRWPTGHMSQEPPHGVLALLIGLHRGFHTDTLDSALPMY